MQLNSQQQDVLTLAAKDDCSIVVEALPGTGKTTLLAALANTIEGSTLVAAFGKKTAVELESRVTRRGVRIGSTHALGMSVWGKHHRGCTIEPKKVRLLLDKHESPMASKHTGFLCQLIGHAKRAGFGLLTTTSKVSNWEELIRRYNLVCDPEDIFECIHVAISVYDKSLSLCPKQVDLDDMPLAPSYFGCRFPKYANVLVDELQDTSPIRLHLLLEHLVDGGRIIGVGDSNQCIMAFTGTQMDSMASIIGLLKAKTMPLSMTYRCPKVVVNVAKQWLPSFEAAPSNDNGLLLASWLHYKPEHAQPPLHAGRLFWDLGPFTMADAVLCRTTKPLIKLAYQMFRRGIKCYVEGRDIGIGVLQFSRKWKYSTLEDLAAKVEGYKQTECAQYMHAKEPEQAGSVTDKCDTLLVLIDLALATGKNLSDTILGIFGDRDTHRDCVVLSTIHKAKGLEWPRVFILGLNAPPTRHLQDWEVKTERHLKVVAVTRSQHTLVLVEMPNNERKSNELEAEYGWSVTKVGEPEGNVPERRWGSRK